MRAVRTVAMFAATYCLLQAGSLLTSPAVRYRLGLLAAGTEVAEELAKDPVYSAATAGYLTAKAQFSPGTRRRLRHLEFYARQSAATAPAFRQHLSRICPPCTRLYVVD